MHVDVYRLLDHDGVDLIAELDSWIIDTDLDDAVVVVEWGEGLAERLRRITSHHAGTRHRRRFAPRRVLEPGMTLVLALDTSHPGGDRRRAAAPDDGRINWPIGAPGRRACARRAADAEHPCRRCRRRPLGLGAVDAVVVGCGPGPFTGLRVGMATAAAYGHALHVPVHGVCSLDALGNQTHGEVLVVTDARRREVYWARYRDGVRMDGPRRRGSGDVPVGG